MEIKNFKCVVKNPYKNAKAAFKCADMLPKTDRHIVTFDLNGVCVAFANAIRRTLIEELKVVCLDCIEFKTNDDFILEDILRKKINLIPIKQVEYTSEVLKGELKAVNDSNKPRHVYSDEIQFKDKVKLNRVIIATLKPKRFLNIKNFRILTGYSKDSANKFSLLNNVSYKINYKEKHYDQFTKTGVRSCEINPTSFTLSFETCGNITVQDVFNKLYDTLMNKFLHVKSIINKLLATKSNVYIDDDVSLSTQNNKDGLREYKFYNKYITTAYLLAQKAYMIEPSTPFISASIDRFDNSIAIIKIKHPNATKLLNASVDGIIKDVEHFNGLIKKCQKK